MNIAKCCKKRQIDSLKDRQIATRIARESNVYINERAGNIDISEYRKSRAEFCQCAAGSEVLSYKGITLYLRACIGHNHSAIL